MARTQGPQSADMKRLFRCVIIRIQCPHHHYLCVCRTQCRLLLPAVLSLGLVAAVWRLGREAATLLHPLQAASTLIR